MRSSVDTPIRRHTRTGKTLTALALGIALAATPIVPPVASAVPLPGATLEEQVAAFRTQLEDIGREAEIVSEQLNAANHELGAVRDRIAGREMELEAARKQQQAIRARIDLRLRETYRIGPVTYLEVLFSSQSVTALLDRFEFLTRVASIDSADAREIEEKRRVIEAELIGLRGDELDARSLEFELSSRKLELERRRIEFEQLYQQASSEVRLQYEQQQTARRTTDAAAFTALLSGDVVVEPGGPVETALAYRGIPYVWGGESKSGMDCSGLVLYVFAQHGVPLPHYSGAQFNIGQAVPVSQLQPGDVVFFGSPIHHVGIYIGGGYFIHAPTFGDVVKVSRLSGMRNYAGAQRYAWVPRTGPIR